MRVWLWLRVGGFALVASALVYVSALWWLQGILDLVVADVRLVQDAVGWLRQAGPFGLALTALSPAFVLAWHFALRREKRRGDTRRRAAEGVAEWVVDRPEELGRIVAALLRRGSGTTVGVTTALHGAGGFGKTTLAQMVRADRRVRRRFGDRTVWVTIGRDLRGGAAIVEKVHEVIRQVAPDEVSRNAALGRAVNVEAAGRELGLLLDSGPRMLLFVDDVWFAEQLQPFVQGGRGCARLVTTRNRQLMHGRGVVVLVDQMSQAQARRVLLFELPPFDPAVVAALLEVTGRWPLLLRLINKILTEAHGAGWDLADYGRRLLDRLRIGGPAAIDPLVGAEAPMRADAEVLDVQLPGQRARAVAATMQASIGLLTPAQARQLAELAVFADDEIVPLALVTRLWQATSGVDELLVPHLCARLNELALIRLDPSGGGKVSMHDVVRDYLHDRLRRESGEDELAGLHRLLLDEVARTLPEEGAWWELGDEDWYLWDNLIGHMIAAGWAERAEALAGDLRWVQARLSRFGPAAPVTDLARVGTAHTERIRRALTRTAHLLVPTDPSIAVIDVLHSRLAADPDWGQQVRALQGTVDRPRLVNHWPLPDLPDRALRHILIGHTGAVSALAISADGSWLATGAHDHTVRIWDVATGRQRSVLSGHAGAVSALAISADGSWLATGAHDHTVRIWEMATGRQRTVLNGHADAISSLAINPDGTTLASTARDRSVRLWDVARGAQRETLQRRGSWMRGVAIADGRCLAISSEDSGVNLSGTTGGTQRSMLQGHANWRRGVATTQEDSWLAAGGEDSRVRIWDVATGRQCAVLHGLTHRVSAVTISVDGSWLATGAHDGGLRIWDVVTGSQRAVLRGHTASVLAGATSRDGAWLATAGQDNTARVWEVATGRQHAVLHNLTARVAAITISPDGTWLVTGGADGRARVWDVAAGQRPARQLDHTAPVSAIAASPQGLWLATGGADGRIRVWEVATGRQQTVLPGHTAPVLATAAGPDGSALATGAEDTRVRVWDVTGASAQKLVLHGHCGAVVFHPGGSWLAAGGTDGRIRVWEAATGRQQTVLSGHTGAVSALAVGRDGLWLASSGDDGRIRLWDIATGRARATWQGRAASMAVAVDGSWLAAGGPDHRIRIWDTDTGELRAVWESHIGPVRTTALSDDGKWLASGGDDGTIRIWRVATGQPVTTMRVDGEITCCAWIPGSAVLAAGGPAGIYAFSFTGPCR